MNPKTKQEFYHYTLCSKNFKVLKSGTTSSLLRHLYGPHKNRFRPSSDDAKIEHVLKDGIKWKPNDPRQIACNKRLVYMIVKDYKSLNTVERQGFRLFVQALQPRYKMPCRKTVTKKLIPATFRMVKNDVIKELQEVKHIAITSDLGSTITNEAFNSVTAHYLNPKTLNLETKVLQCKSFEARHTGDELEIDIEDCLKENNIR